MKPSTMIKYYKEEFNDDHTMRDTIIDEMAKDIKQIKFLIKYICPEDVLNVHKLEKRKWEE